MEILKRPVIDDCEVDVALVDALFRGMASADVVVMLRAYQVDDVPAPVEHLLGFLVEPKVREGHQVEAPVRQSVQGHGPTSDPEVIAEHGLGGLSALQLEDLTNRQPKLGNERPLAVSRVGMPLGQAELDPYRRLQGVGKGGSLEAVTLAKDLSAGVFAAFCGTVKCD